MSIHWSPGLLPPNATLLERALDVAAARILEIRTDLRSLWSPADCPESHLPWLAWQLSLDSWSTDWPIAIKRARIRRAIEISRSKGTAQSVRAVVESFGGGVAIREWWQQDPPAAAFTFDLVLSLSNAGGLPVTAAFVDAVMAEVARTKPVRSHFTFTQALAARADIGMHAAGRPVTYARLSSLGN